MLPTLGLIDQVKRVMLVPEIANCCVCEGFSVTLAGDSVCAREAVAIVKSITANESWYIARMVVVASSHPSEYG